jgi:hypothetical protein
LLDLSLWACGEAEHPGSEGIGGTQLLISGSQEEDGWDMRKDLATPPPQRTCPQLPTSSN